MTVWVSKKDLLALGVGEATIYRKDRDKVWESRRAESDGRGQPPKEYLFDSLPADLQIAWLKLDGERRAGAATDETDNQNKETDRGVLSEFRLSRLVAALARFSPPVYTLDQKESVQRRCVELGKLCDEGAAL